MTQDAYRIRWFEDLMHILHVVVHPAYWHRGHGKALAKCFIDIANQDERPLRVIAGKRAKRMFEEVGFQ
jgi:N-acetylglutamate synthase-like GNAT family acetyltransferase